MHSRSQVSAITYKYKKTALEQYHNSEYTYFKEAGKIFTTRVSFQNMDTNISQYLSKMSKELVL